MKEGRHLMKKRWLHLIAPTLALGLEMLPYGAVCNFANPEGEPWRRTYSYFDLLPFGYANFAPFLTALLTCVILVLLLVYVFTGASRLAAVTRNLLVVCTVLSLCPLLLGIDYFSVVGSLITLVLLVETVWLSAMVRKTDER